MMASIVASCAPSISASASISASLIFVFRFASRYSPSDRWSEASAVSSIIQLRIGCGGSPTLREGRHLLLHALPHGRATATLSVALDNELRDIVQGAAITIVGKNHQRFLRARRVDISFFTRLV